MVWARGLQARRWSGLEAKRFRYLWATAPPRLLIIRRGKLSIEMLTIITRTFVLALKADHKVWLAAPLIATAVALVSCAALQPPSATGPRGNEPLYPILFTEDSRRKESIAVALNRLAVQAGNSDSTAAQLQPVTATILSITPKANGSLYLPKVGATAVMNEEETRESLRRFIKEWPELIGSDPAKLSLVERVDQPDGSKLANYEQRPFRYPIRGNYGKLQILFNAERRVLNLTSSCIPDTDRIQTLLSGINVRLKAEDVVQQMRENGLEYTDAKGIKVNFKVPPASEITPRGLVTYILSAKDRPDALEFHLAWEMELSNAPVKIAYIDGITGETVAAE
jgi:hypothetical protein